MTTILCVALRSNAGQMSGQDETTMPVELDVLEPIVVETMHVEPFVETV